MCLGVIGRIIEVWDDGGVPMAAVDGGVEPVCLLYAPEARRGDAVLVQHGFVVLVLEPEEADRASALRREIGL